MAAAGNPTAIEPAQVFIAHSGFAAMRAVNAEALDAKDQFSRELLLRCEFPLSAPDVRALDMSTIAGNVATMTVPDPPEPPPAAARYL
jgi:hypothetical protein